MKTLEDSKFCFFNHFCFSKISNQKMQKGSPWRESGSPQINPNPHLKCGNRWFSAQEPKSK
jgi:hypothetical protein